MSAKLGITMIEMYCDMIKEQFKPITEALDLRDSELEDVCRVQAKKDLGIYDKMMLQAKLSLQLEELKEELASYTSCSYPRNKNKIDRLTEQKMAALKNGFHKKVETSMKDMIYGIRLSGLDNDTKNVFNRLPAVIESLSKELKALPAPTKKLIKAKK